MAHSDHQIDRLRNIASQLAATGELSHQQALVYSFRVIGDLDRGDAVFEMDVKPSTADTHLQRAKQTVSSSQELTRLQEIYQGEPTPLSEGMILREIPESWEETPVRFTRNESLIQVYRLSDNRFVICEFDNKDTSLIEILAVGGFNITTQSFNRRLFEEYFMDEFGIDLRLSKESYINIATGYQTLVENPLGRLLDGLPISDQWDYLETEHKEFGRSPSWVAVNSVDELVHTTIKPPLTSTEQLRTLKKQFRDTYEPTEHATTGSGSYADEEAERRMQYYAHIGEAFCKATNSSHPLTFEWEICPQKHNSASEEQAKRFYEREYYKNVTDHTRDRMLETHLGLDLSTFK